MKISISTLLLSVVLVIGCTKQSKELTETLGDTTGNIVSTTVDSVVSDTIITDSLNAFQRNISNFEKEGKYEAIYEGEGKTFKITFRSDEEGTPVVVISDNGKDFPWLYLQTKTDSTATYKNADKLPEFFISDNTASFKLENTIYRLKAK